MDASDENFATVQKMIAGFRVSQIVSSAADLSLAEHLADGPRGAEEIATIEDADPGATLRLMRACVSLGLLDYEDGRFSGTESLRVLHREAPNSLRNYALRSAAPGMWLPVGRMKDAVRTGASQDTRALGKPLFDYLSDHPEEGALASASVSDLSGPVIANAVPVVDVTDVGLVVDVGGAKGTFVLSLMAEHPDLRGAVLELAYAVPAAEAEARRRGLAERFVAVPGDFFDAVPGADLYLLKFILHDWDDAASVEVLRRCREAMRPGARVAVLEMVIEEQGGGPAPLMDMTMLALTGGKERTVAEFDALFAEAGLRRSRLTEVREPYHLIEAVAL